MWWRFWRRRRDAAGAVEPDLPPDGSPVLRSGGRDDQDEGAARPSAFSGATPTVAADLDAAGLHAAGFEPPNAPADADRVRDALVELVTAALAQDRDAVEAVVGRLGRRAAELEAAALSGLAALGSRLLVAADVTAADAFEGGLAAAGVLAQADTVADRAERLRTGVVPEVPPRRLRDTARHAVGEDVETGAGADPRQLLLATAVLLAQTCRDGQGDPDDLAAELEVLDG